MRMTRPGMGVLVVGTFVVGIIVVLAIMWVITQVQ